MKPKTKVLVKSREEIEETFNLLDIVDNKTYVEMKNNKTLGELDIEDWLWTLCGKTLMVLDTKNQTHKFDYNYFDYPSPKEERTAVHIIYFMEEWLEPVSDEVVDVE